jgi:branched-chain amino acid transport system ATP-binding protein
MGDLALNIENLDVHYGDFQALRDVSLVVKAEQVVSIIGSNGAGKSTLLGAVSGVHRQKSGRIELFGERIDRMAPHQIVARGLALVPEGRRVFSRMSVEDNLILGSYTPKARARRDNELDRVYQLFSRLKERRRQRADTLSGGEQQMLAISRALMSQPKILLCDEISLGLAPLIVKMIYDRLAVIRDEGVTLVIVEQDITRSLEAAEWVSVLLEGKIVLAGDPEAMTLETVKDAYFGVNGVKNDA